MELPSCLFPVEGITLQLQSEFCPESQPPYSFIYPVAFFWGLVPVAGTHLMTNTQVTGVTYLLALSITHACDQTG